ncbi:phosphatase PAP2 family protein [Pirellulimonas nuda]|nr:phosphatase PAP2 family protein [Pirellulimonas nuda]
MAQQAVRILRLHVAGRDATTPRGSRWLLWGPLLALLGCLLIFRMTYADIAVSECCYCQLTERWPMADAQPWLSLYEYGCLPAMVLGIGGLLTTLVCVCLRRGRKPRRAGLFLALSLLLGPGLLVNFMLKPMMGRPRPAQTEVFGGEESFVLVGTPAQLENCRSFPSGHASMGFYLMAPAFMLKRKQKKLAAAFLALGIGFGLLMGAARILQGAHFASDVLGAVICVYIGALAAKLILGFGGWADRVWPEDLAETAQAPASAPTPTAAPPTVWGDRVAA